MTGKKPNAYEMGELEQIYLKHLKNVMGRDEYITQVMNKRDELPGYTSFTFCAWVVVREATKTRPKIEEELICPFIADLVNGSHKNCIKGQCAIYNKNMRCCAILALSMGNRGGGPM